MSTPRLRAAAVAAAGSLLASGLAACSTASHDRPTDVLNAIQARQQAALQAGTAAQSSAAPAAANCSPGPQASYPKLSSVTIQPGSLEEKIKQRGYLVVGVAGDTRLLGARNALTEPDPSGFDIEIAKAIGRAIFGQDGHVHFKVITAGQRFPVVNAGVNGTTTSGVDMVARAVSMTCARWADAASDVAQSKGSAFSVAYLQSTQKILVRQGVNTLDELIKAKQQAKSTVKVCAPSPSTSIDGIKGIAGVTPVPVAIHSDCLALWQEGKVDAITGDDVILAGFKAQDRTNPTIIGYKGLATTPYGLAISKQHREFVQYVNAVMATPQFHAAWTKAFDDYLAGPLAPSTQDLPTPDYSRPLPG